MERSPALGAAATGNGNGAASQSGGGAGDGGGGTVPSANANAPASPSTLASSSSKPSLSQQILRTFRPRASVTAAPFVSSATASPMVRAIDAGSAHPASSSAGGVTGTSSRATNVYNATLLEVTPQDAKAAAAMTLAEYQQLLQELREPLPAAEQAAVVQQRVHCVQTLLAGLKYATDTETAEAESDHVDWTTHRSSHYGPPQAEVFKICLLLLTQAREGLLPLALCLAVCELATASVRLSDLRASKATKAARETRSGAPGSQSSKADLADHPLANIDRAALYVLVCHLSDHTRGAPPSKENNFETQLPALPMQLKALDCLSLEGRDIASFPGILEFLGDATETMWEELQVLRRMHSSSSSSSTEGATDDALRTTMVEQLTVREWCVLSCLQLVTSIIKYSFAKLDLHSIEDVLLRVSGMLHSAEPPAASNVAERSREQREARRARSKSKERRPLTDGYDYYGLDVLNMSDTPSASATPRGVMTPRLAPRSGGATSEAAAAISVAPITLATVPPTSLSAAATKAARATQRKHAQPILQESEVRAALKLLDSVLHFGFMPPNSVATVTQMLCCILGHNVVQPNAESDWASLARPVLAALLRSHCANASLRAARSVLVNEQEDEDVTVLSGAIEFIKGALSLAAEDEQQQQQRQQQQPQSSTTAGDKPSPEDALAPTLSVPLLMPALAGALRRHIDSLDIQVLDLVSEMLPLKDGRAALGQHLTSDDWDMLLDLPGVAKRHLQGFYFRFRQATLPSGDKNTATQSQQQRTQLLEQKEASKTPAVIGAMLHLVSRLRMAGVNDAEEGKEGANELPWTPKLASLLLSLAPFLSDSIIVDLVGYYKARHLCIPRTPEWIANIHALNNALFHRHLVVAQANVDQVPTHGSVARETLVRFLFEDVYGTVQDMPAHRARLLQEVILPLAQTALAAESDTFVESTLRRTLVEAAITAISTTGAAAASLDDDEDESNQAIGDAIFREIVELHCKLAASSAAHDGGGHASVATTSANATASSSAKSAPTSALHHVSFADPPGSHEHKAGGAGSRTHSRSNSITSAAAHEAHEANGIKSVAALPDRSKAVRSALDLISIFYGLAFSSPWVLLPTNRKKEHETILRMAWEKRARNACLTIFRALLALVKPASRDGNGLAAASTAVRLAILQWLVRLRTDGEHRVYLAGDLYELIAPSASTLRRGPQAPNDGADPPISSAAMEQQDSHAERATRSRRDTAGGGGREPLRNWSAAERSASRIRDASRERGRREQVGDTSNEGVGGRYRSPNRAGAQGSSPAQPPPKRAQEPMWRVPETLLFEVPPPGWRSDVVFTYLHPNDDETAHHHHVHRHAPDLERATGEPPQPMPISDYVATCVELLSFERDWELVSYLLCHLPMQLANKHLVCGPKAKLQVMALRQMLAASILEQQFVNQVTLPDDVKKSDVYAVAYGTLTTLISYRTLFSRAQQDELVEAFMAGLNKSSNTAQPCIRALSVACYELQKSINRYLPKMLVKLTTVMSSSTMSVHILELIATIGHLPSLYANFTEVDYRRIFGIALQYVQYHNQRSAEEDARLSATEFTLSQYVIMLAYYNISLWFLIVKLSDRAKYVENIRKNLLLANEGRTKVADQTEVCFDFLARYAHSNAEPRPQQSFLHQIVKAKDRGVRNAGAGAGGGGANDALAVKHYLHGKGLLTVSTLDKNGWAEVLVRKPSGTIGLLCKLENVPMTRLPDEDEEKYDLPAAMMMDRRVAPTKLSLSQRVRRQLDERDARRPLGPAHFGLARRPRSASFTSDERTAAPARITFVRKDVDPYVLAAAEDADDAGYVLQPESEELKETMRRVLADGGGVTMASTAAAEEGNPSTKTTASRNEHAVNPGFLALQLSSYPDTEPSNRPPVLLPNEPWVERMLRSLDLTPTVDFHRIGVLYVGAGQTTEQEILGNRTGSTRYAQFLRGLGDLITLRGQQNVYTGGLDTQRDEHGKYAYVWGDDISQLVFHTTTLMPNDEVNDALHARKKALIGNDWVRIVWNESGREYVFDTIKTQFNYLNIVISPNSRGGVELGNINAADAPFYRVSLQCIDGLPNFSPVGDGQLVSAAALPSFVRLLALNCSLITQIYVATCDRIGTDQPFAYLSNWVNRLHYIDRTRAKMDAATAAEAGGASSTETERIINAGDMTAYDISRF